MTDPVTDIRVLDRSSASRELDLASELFHRINRVIPENQSVLTVRPNCPVRQAVAQMLEHGYSQVPVIEDGSVLGIFSFRSFSKGAANAGLDEWTKQRCAPGDLPVDEFLEQFRFARVTEEMTQVFDAMDKDNGVLIGTPDRLIGILTPLDFLRYLYRVASPFVTVSEIELAVRALIRSAMDDHKISIAAQRCLSSAYGGNDKTPTSLEDMTFNNYESLVSHSENWAHLERAFGGTRTRTSGKLKEIGSIRNNLFHFKGEISENDRKTLNTHRDWLLTKVKQAGSRITLETGR